MWRLREDYHAVYYSCMMMHMRNQLFPLLAPTEPNLKTTSSRSQILRLFERTSLRLVNHRRELCKNCVLALKNWPNLTLFFHSIMKDWWWVRSSSGLFAPEASLILTIGIRIKRWKLDFVTFANSYHWRRDVQLDKFELKPQKTDSWEDACRWVEQSIFSCFRERVGSL